MLIKRTKLWDIFATVPNNAINYSIVIGLNDNNLTKGRNKKIVK